MKKLVSSLGSLALAFSFVAGCAEVDPSLDSSDNQVEQERDFAPSATVKTAKKSSDDDGLFGKGFLQRTYGYTHIENYTVQPGQTVRYTTSRHPSYNDVDTYIALFVRDDNSSELMNMNEGQARINLNTLATNDDIDIRNHNTYSTASWKNNTTQPVNVFCAVFGYSSNTGVALLTRNNEPAKAVEVRAGSAEVRTGTAGRIWTDHTVAGHSSQDNVFLIALELGNGGYNSAANDQDADGNPGGNDSDINGFTSNTPVLVIAHGGGYYSQGTTYINY